MQVKIISKVNYDVSVNSKFNVNVTAVYFIVPLATTSRTYKTHRLDCRVYINKNKKLQGHDYYSFKKPVSISKSDPIKNLESKYNVDFQRMFQHAFDAAMTKYFETKTNLQGKVLYFDRSRGEGMIDIPTLGITLPVYACNLKGKRTWYAETACTYLDAGQTVLVEKLARVSNGLTCIVNEGVKFDSDKWETLKDKDLAFRCNDSGETVTGLF